MKRTTTTKHAGKRMKERLNIKSPARQERMANLALERGKFLTLQERMRQGRRVINMILEYQERYFVFSEDKRLITVLPYRKRAHQSKASLLQFLTEQERSLELRYAYR